MSSLTIERDVLDGEDQEAQGASVIAYGKSVETQDEL